MAPPLASHIKNIAVVGATGNLGSLAVKYLLEAERFTVTAISRSPESPFPASPSLIFKTGDYSSPNFLTEIFTNQDAVVFAMHFSAIPDLEVALIEAAAKAGVKWILPAEFGSDNGNRELEEKVSFNLLKRIARDKVEDLARAGYEDLRWIGVITGPWFDLSMKLSAYQIDIKQRNALLLDGGMGKFNTTNLATAGLAIARLLSLPITSSSGASLSDFDNKFVYVRSFLTSQREILDAAQKVTKTTDADWAITYTDGQAFIDEGSSKLARGDFHGVLNLVYGNTMMEGHGGDYETTKGVSNGALGLPDESLEDAVRDVVEQF